MRRRKRRTTKRQAEAIHAKRRARERLGKHWNRTDLARLVGRIQAREYILAEKLTNTRTRFRLDIDGEDVTLIYDRKRAMVVTVWKTFEHEKGY